MDKCKCGRDADGLADGMCQMCWEEYASAEWWKQAKATQELVEAMKRGSKQEKQP